MIASRTSGFTLFQWNIHNFGVAADPLQQVRDWLLHNRAHARQQPVSDLVVVAGGFDIADEDTERISPGSGSP
eukprot:8631181-Pyramimonas_sp.AAC.1